MGQTGGTAAARGHEVVLAWPSRAAAASSALARARLGFWVLTGYYLADLAAMAATGWIARTAAGPLVLGSLLLGILLLVGVTISNARARKPLRQLWPELARVTPPVPAQRPRRRRGTMQIQSGAAGALYVCGLVILAAIAGISVTVADSAAATATTQVTIVSCNNAWHGQEELCSAQWVADGQVRQGTISWSSEPGTTIGRYDPAEPGIVYNASMPWLDGTTVMAGTLILALGPWCLYGLVGYRRKCRAPYWAQLADVAATSTAGPL
jgi:hypothetical protein